MLDRPARFESRAPHADELLDILGHSLDMFPPTAFHGATLVGDRIAMIGSLDYPDAQSLQSMTSS